MGASARYAWIWAILIVGVAGGAVYVATRTPATVRPERIRRGTDPEPEPLREPRSPAPETVVTTPTQPDPEPPPTAEVLDNTSPSEPVEAHVDASEPDADVDERVRSAQREANEALAKKDFIRARAAAMRCLADDPDNKRCRRVRIYSYTRQHDKYNVGTVLKYCLSAYSDDARCLSSMQDIHLRNNEFTEAGDLAKEIDDIEPESGVGYEAKAKLSLARGKKTEAREAFETACDLGEKVACQSAAKLKQEGF